MSSNKLTPLYFGYVGSTKDALLIIQQILNKNLNLIPRRPHERERSDLIRSGNVFIFVEEHSGIKRWTDGISWSPSRILGRFLVYRELDKDNLEDGRDIHKKRAKKRKLSLSTEDIDSANSLISSQHGFKDQGLIKKTLSITTTSKELNMFDKAEKQTIHLISYYNANDVLNGELSRPSESDLKNVVINSYLWNAIKESNLGGKIPIEDEAYYFLDNNYQLQNMSLINTANPSATGPSAPVVPTGASVAAAAATAPGYSQYGNPHPHSSMHHPVYYKGNYMLPIPNYDYYYYNNNNANNTPNNASTSTTSTTAGGNTGKEEDTTFVNPFTAGPVNFNLSLNLSSFYHDNQGQNSQASYYTQLPQHFDYANKKLKPYDDSLHLHHVDEHYVYNT